MAWILYPKKTPPEILVYDVLRTAGVFINKTCKHHTKILSLFFTLGMEGF